MKHAFLWLAMISMSILACNDQATPETKEKEAPMKTFDEKTFQEKLNYTDHHSYARIEEAVVTHLSWNAEVDFDQKIIKATATYKINNKKGVDTIYLDSRNLNIMEVRRDDHEGALGYMTHDRSNFLGTELAIPISLATQTISIDYSTTEGAAALQFLEPVQTAGKKHPFLFTQSQAILARTWIPCQDSPGIRFTYDATVKVPKGMMALMSASNPTAISEDGLYNFEMDQAVPSYLMALAVGNISYQSLGNETGVYAEPELIEASAYEFADMQNMVDTAESLYGPYRWGKYDVIVLPPSFPFGGMENPRLTFATPTIIAGDRSLTALIAHELAHSWSGNLVTNAAWEDIWLNEGFTVYFENRIMEEIFGADFANMLAILSYQDLNDEIARLTEEGKAADTRLRLELKDRDPDEGLTAIPYDKGFYLLKLIEETVGREKWDEFLKSYFDKFAFQIMTTDAFVYYLTTQLINQNEAWGDQIRLEEWVHGEGLPDNCPKVNSTRFAQVEDQLSAWQNGAEPTTLASDEWMTPEWLHFLRNLPDEMGEEQMKALDKGFGFTNSGNSEIVSAWFEKVIPNNYQAAEKATEKFLFEVGRRKFLVPIYKAVLKSEKGKERARSIYEKARPNYHAVSSETLDKMLLD
ncbi:MAG: aminopeptidase [Verrucomicrobia bacterium]|nr:aminopeptidase [Verrucomicrobiota bacterium]